MRTGMATGEKLIGAAEFEEKYLKILKGLESPGVVVTQRGQPAAKLTPFQVVDNAKLIGR